MQTDKKIALAVGVLFITATAAYSLGMFLLDGILYGPDFPGGVAEQAPKVLPGAFFILIDSLAVAALSIIIFPVLKRRNESAALGYAGARIVESVFFMAEAASILTILALSRDLTAARGGEQGYYLTLGTILRSAGNQANLLGLGLAFPLSALILNALLFQTRLVPRWLSAWGFLGAVGVFANFLLQFFGGAPVQVLFLPIAVQEMVFALWLIIKGFRAGAE